MKIRYVFLLIASVSILIYANSLNNSFQYDDQVYLEENTNIRTTGMLDIFTHPSRLFAPNTATGHYRPLVLLFHVINYRIHGLNSFGYRVVNLAFHIGSAMLLFLIIRAMLGSGIALTAAIIFAVHPFNSEVVNYITARSSVMSGFFYLLAFYCWVRFRGEETDVSRLTSYVYLASLLAFLLGMLSKEVVITLPIVLWLYDIYFIHPLRTLLNWRTYIPYLPFVLVLAIPALVIRVIYWGEVMPSFKRSLLVQFYTELPVLVKHLRLFIFPVGLNIDHYSEIYKTFFAWPVAGSALILILYVVLAILAYRSKAIEWRVVSFFMIWFFIVLLPTSVVTLNIIFQENRGYLAIIVFAVFAGVMLGKPFPPFGKGGKGGFEIGFPGEVKRHALIVLIILILLYGAGTVYRNSVWSNGVRLWSDAVMKSPKSSRAYTNLGIEYAGQGRNDLAIGSFLKALRHANPEDRAALANIHYNLGTVYLQMKSYDMAVSEYRTVTDLMPGDFRPYYNLGVIHQQNGETDHAISEYREALKRNPSDYRSFHNLGLIYQNRGDMVLAEGFYRKALSLNPDYSRSRFNLRLIMEAK